METVKPRVVLALEHEASAHMLSGMLWLKGCDVRVVKSADECIKEFERLEFKVDVLVVSSELALGREAMLIINVRKKNMETKILAIGDESSDKTRILDYGADEFALKPLSPENVADKILMSLARQTVADNRSP